MQTMQNFSTTPQGSQKNPPTQRTFDAQGFFLYNRVASFSPFPSLSSGHHDLLLIWYSCLYAFVQVFDCSNVRCPFNGKCVERKDGLAMCACQESCSFVPAPVCGSDNRTYINRCMLEVASCSQRRQIVVLGKGPCCKCLHWCPVICGVLLWSLEKGLVVRGPLMSCNQRRP